MDDRGFGSFGSFATPAPVRVEAYTAAFRIDGTVHTPFRRVAEILNQLPSTQLAIDDAVLVEHATGSSVALRRAVLSVDAVALFVAPELGGAPRDDMRIEKQPILTVLVVPPFRISGALYVPVGSEAFDGVVNMSDRFIPMTDVRLDSAAFPSLARDIPIAAVCRQHAQVMARQEAATVLDAVVASEEAS